MKRLCAGVSLWTVVFWASLAGADPAIKTDIPGDVSSGYPHSLDRALAAMLAEVRSGEPGAALLNRLSQIYLDIGDDLYTDEERRREAYEEGARAARRSLDIDDRSADAHFLYAANRGSAARLRGMSAGPFVLKEIKDHVSRAIELDPGHARALQMMGGLLAELPWVLGGNGDDAQRYLQRAIAADPNYTNARLMLAKLYLKQNRLKDAERQLRALLQTPHPHYPYNWRNTFKPEAERLLKVIAEKQ